MPRKFITLDTGEKLALELSGFGMQVKEDAPRFEVVLRDKNDRGKKRVYRGGNPRAVEAVFLNSRSEAEKKNDVYDPSSYGLKTE
jgi:hypothetical protein